ncbi:hypothetical protein [Bradyrhizobium sp. CCBAU 051011]|uniref:hypothetical protein n=1 Tax=Bradyrhizobium sp. CCBAU 051011 TaxID=858422 RepID=UPI0013796791|nr:hypothetical protein [Bradyrhizobium sp. CCBAU 051011]
MARRLAAQLDLILEDAAMLADSASLDLSPSQIETMLRAVVASHLTKLERVSLAAKGDPDFDADQARLDASSRTDLLESGQLHLDRRLIAQAHEAPVGATGS